MGSNSHPHPRVMHNGRHWIIRFNDEENIPQYVGKFLGSYVPEDCEGMAHRFWTKTGALSVAHHLFGEWTQVETPSYR